MHSTMANPDEPELRVWITGKQTTGCRKDVLGYLERTGFDINGDDLACAALFYL
jgi:hypothetical protein